MGDVNGDGKLDAITSLLNGNQFQIGVLLGKGDGSFQSPILTNTNTAPPVIVITDLNGDGKPDLLLGDCCGLTEASYLRGNGDGTFRPEFQFPSGPDPAGLTVADFNGDGKPDAAVIGQRQSTQLGTLAILLNTSGSASTGYRDHHYCERRFR